MDDLDDFFGKNPVRPDHPDFWRLSEQVLGHDGALDAAREDTDKQEAWRRIVVDLVDERSLTYMAVQRAMRMLDVTTREQLVRRAEDVARLSTMYLDGFVAGASFQRAGGHREPTSRD